MNEAALAALVEEVNLSSRMADIPDQSGDGIPTALMQLHLCISTAALEYAHMPAGAVRMSDTYAQALADVVVQVLDHAGSDSVGGPRFARLLRQRIGDISACGLAEQGWTK